MSIRRLTPCFVLFLCLALTACPAYSQELPSLFDDLNPAAQPSEGPGDSSADEVDSAKSSEDKKVRELFRLVRNLIARRNQPEALKQIAALRDYLQADGGLATVVLETAADDAQRAAALDRAGDVAQISRFAESLERSDPIGKQHLNEFERMVASLKVLRKDASKGMDDQKSSGVPGGYGGYGGYGGGGYGGDDIYGGGSYGGGGYGEGGYGQYGGGYGGSDDAGDGYGATSSSAVEESVLQQTHLQEQIDMLRLELRRAVSVPESRRKIVAAIRKLVSEQFDGRTDQRTEQLEALEKRLGKLRQHLKQRNDAKDDIVDVRVKMYVNEARGLGF